MIDILLGTVDRSDLDSGWLEPERHLWWDYRTDWVQQFASDGAGELVKHPNYNVNEIVE